MRIMLIVNEFPPEKIAGTGMATQALAEHLSDCGHHVLVLVTTRCPEDKRDQIKSSDYELRWMHPRPLRATGIVWRIWHAWKYARRFAPQIIQGQAVSCGLIAAVVGKLMGVPSICYAQGYDVYEAHPWQRYTEIRWGCRWPDCLLAVTRHLAARIEDVTGIASVTLMPHAFDMPDSFPDRDTARKALHLEPHHRVVLSVGRLEIFKGHDVLIRAWSDFSRQHPEAVLWIVGMGSQEECLRQQVDDPGIAGTVCFTGSLPAIEVHQRMAAADLFVLPSRSEPFGIVLLEAMAHGLPVVASDTGGIPEVVPAQGNATLVPAGDAEALKRVMLDMFSGDFSLSEENRQHAMKFEWGLQVERFESIYHQLLGKV